MMDLIDLTVRCFKHGSDLGELERLREAGELIGGYYQIGARSPENVVAINAKKLFIEVALEWYSLRVKLLLGPHKDILVCSALCMVDVLVLTSGTFLLGLAIPRGAIDADVEDRTTPEKRERKLLGEGFGEGLRGALRVGVWIFL